MQTAINVVLYRPIKKYPSLPTCPRQKLVHIFCSLGKGERDSLQSNRRQCYILIDQQKLHKDHSGRWNTIILSGPASSAPAQPPAATGTTGIMISRGFVLKQKSNCVKAKGKCQKAATKINTWRPMCYSNQARSTTSNRHSIGFVRDI